VLFRSSSLSPEELQLFDTIQESKKNMNQTTQLRQLIRESIQEYIREIDEAGNRAALEAKMTKTQEAIDTRKKKLNMEGLDEAYHDMMDKGKMKEMTSEIKMLEKSLAKYGKMLEKMDNKNTPKMEEMEDKDVEEEMIDEVSIDENDPESGPQLEETEQVYEMLLMQKRAGIISEAEYKAKIEEAKKKMTAAQKEKKEDIVKGMKKSKSFGKSKEEKAKMYATATKLATKKKAKGLKEEVQSLFEFEVGDTIAVTVPQDFSIEDNSGTIKAVYANYSAIPKNWKEYGPDPDAYEEEELNSPWYLVMQSNGQEEVFSKSDIK
jgi:hypothetical protein